MHIYSVLDKLFTPKVEQNKVQNNTNEQKTNFQAEKEEKVISNNLKPKIQPQIENKNASTSSRLETCFVSFPKNGDTIAVLYNKQQTTFRLAGINAYEKGVRWNKLAVKYLVEQIGKKPVFINVLDKDTDGNSYVEVYLDKEKTKHINKMLLDQDFPIDIKPKVEEGIKKPQKIEDVMQKANEEISELKAKDKVIVDAIPKENEEVLEKKVQDKTVENAAEQSYEEGLPIKLQNKVTEDNSLWTGIPDDIEDIPMIMPDDDYFWQSQMGDSGHLDLITTNSQDAVVEFNPFVYPPIEPLSVYPNGVKPTLPNNDLPVDNSILVKPQLDINNFEPSHSVSDNFKDEVKNESTSVENNNVIFNPFVYPPIEPLSVYPNEVKHDLQNEISSLNQLEKLEVNIPIDKVPELLSQIDTVIEEVNLHVAESSSATNHNIAKEDKVLISEKPITTINAQDITSSTSQNIDKPASNNATENKKVVLKFASKGKANISKPKDEIEAALDLNEKTDTSKPSKEVVQVLPVSNSSETLSPSNNSSEFQKKNKKAASLPEECNPFSDMKHELENSNVDALGILENYDSLGDIVPEESENNTTKRKKLGR